MNPTVQDIEESLNAVRMNKEHRIQLDLLDELSAEIRTDITSTEAMKKLDRLLSYTGLHFLSEQLVMRHHEYDEYEDHTTDHANILGHLRGLQAALAKRSQLPSTEEVESASQRILDHIGSHDQRLHLHIGG